MTEYVYRVVDQNGDVPTNVTGRAKVYNRKASATSQAKALNEWEHELFNSWRTPPNREQKVYRTQRAAVVWEDLDALKDA
ncbi:hypothetical protein HUO13_11925 [Saccharopolyspora erythraea]|uniref:hypothetical protein n=1 Tax=Saccharopolyspora erythraea TaxID=1836 RepID=UPI001BAB04CD|nr:hypothetical protein [Saccharopolyspora erythraea]QUH01423.1 hypothetical protein HUO13_11925 [Saccharopolyspora erythraea]